MAPWIMPIYDNLDVLFENKHSKLMLDSYIDDGLINVEAMPYIRGRSISNSIIIVDEAQNLDINELKTIITRVGEGSKIILTGDIEQIDRKYLDPTMDGIVSAIDKLLDNEIYAHIKLNKVQRSKVANLAVEKIMTLLKKIKLFFIRFLFYPPIIFFLLEMVEQNIQIFLS